MIGKWIDLLPVKKLYIDYIVSEMKKNGANLVKSYVAGDITYLQFDVKDIFEKDEYKDVFRRADQYWNSESGKLFSK